MYRTHMILCILLVCVGCATVDLQPLPPGHPANLDTADEPPLPELQVLNVPERRQAEAPPDTSPHDGHSQGLGSPDIPAQEGFVCPMHPDQTASIPGTCAVCGMKLVPKEDLQ